MNSRIRREALEHVVGEGDRNCIWELRMNTNAFANLCNLLQVQGGLTEDGHVSLPEQGCLGVLDDTYIGVTVPEYEKARYRTRKGKICTNVFGVCNREVGFVYVLSGWEGSASDSRVLRDVITRRNSLKIPHGNYYLVDAGYTNSPGFLAPYRGTRYHVREWAQGARTLHNYQEYFNRVHSFARNIIERCLGLLKKRWSILRSPSFYPIKTQSQIIIACCLLQNFIRKSMEIDSEEEGSILDEFMPDGDEEQDGMIDVVKMENKRMLSDEETNAFVGFMEEVVVDGQRADCG
ncbi:protein ALP1-like [Arachis ipaensis]|uniref:protein ALP1-like n=1 Tax=Arachis ipaensis TaxID=130454 RepID=UPI000A2B4655|nr:protein ALP1-like [Arachis ipaensis]